jgi:glycerol-3-phosphate O-acyltransferase
MNRNCLSKKAQPLLLLSLLCAFPHVTSWVVTSPSSVRMDKAGHAPTLSSSTTRSRLLATVEEAAAPTATTIAATSPARTPLEPEFEAALQSALTKLSEAIPDKYATTMLPLLAHFVTEYMGATQVALQRGSDPAVCNPKAAAQRILTAINYGIKYGMPSSPAKYDFDVTHKALRGNSDLENGNTIDYYQFGCDFFRPAMDLENSVVLGQELLPKIMKQLEDGENVVLFANHQSEADPQVVSCCLEKVGLGKEASEIVYVAGHKVTTDPLAIPFSMGRNLICIHSKKHINADPTTKPAKQRQNLRSMTALLDLFKKGGTCVWVAPSGGRDRRDTSTGHVPIADFDSKTIDIFRLYGNKSKKPTHFYTLAMVSYDLCPPPDYLAAGVGEERNVRFVPVGIALGDELQSVGGLEHRHDFCEAAQAQCQRDYEALHEALKANVAASA